MNDKLFLLRYDTEAADPEQPDQMAGFFEKIIEVHRKYAIPATFFCCGRSIDFREADFRMFYEEVKNDPLFDIQDHSYSHIGICYENTEPLDVLQADYEKSFSAHERVFGVRPVGVSRCGTSGRNGEKLPGFDATKKTKQEFEMLAAKGVRMINTELIGSDPSRDFINYAALGHPEIMGYPSGPDSDVSWRFLRKFGEPAAYVDSLIRKRANAGEHMPTMLHDWCAWAFGDDKELSHVVRMADTARKEGYTPATHIQCLNDTALWASTPAC